ncbi:MAG: hypothetical protein PWQ51_2297, partial [Methanolobus sp.]|nr:hypothetical protein [Methanolobus sp.]
MEMKNKGKVLLFHCARYNNLTNIVAMGLWGIADYLTFAGYTVEIIHTGVEELYYGNFDVKRYLDDDVIMAGFSAHWFPMVNECIDDAEQLKAVNPSTYISFGGLSGSYFAKELLRGYPFIDVVIKGDGEEPIRVFLEHLISDNMNFEDVPNLVWRKDGEIVDNGITYQNSTENVFDIHYARQDKYLLHYDFAKNTNVFCNSYTDFCSFQPRDFKCGKTYFLLTGKGCPVNCTFCGGGHDAQIIMNNRQKCLYLKDEQIIRTIKEAMELGYKDFSVCFDTKPKAPHYLGWLQRIAEEKLDINLMFGFWGLPPLSVFSYFKNATRNLLFEISPESYSEKIRSKNRGFIFSNKDMEAFIQKCYDEKIYLHIYFAFPMPHETYEDVINTRRYIWETNAGYPHYIEAFYIRLSTDPASFIYRRPEENGCELLINNLQEHLKAARETNGGNILVHKNLDSFPEAEYIYKNIYSDSIVISIFRYAIKLIAKAFDSIDYFMECLDAFYKSIETSSLTYFEYVDAFCESITSEDFHSAPWLKEFMELVKGMLIMSDKLVEISGNGYVSTEAVEKMALNINPEVRLLKEYYNAYDAYQHLLIDKEYCDINRLDEEKYYILYVQNGQVEIEEINITLYELFMIIIENKGKSVKEICSMLAATYTDDEDDMKMIYNDFVQAVQAMLVKGILQN